MAIKYTGDKYDAMKSKVFRVGIDRDNRGPRGMGDIFAGSSVPSHLNGEYKPYRSPSSDGKGEQFFTKYDKQADTNYLYSAEYKTRKLTNAERGINEHGLAMYTPNNGSNQGSMINALYGRQNKDPLDIGSPGQYRGYDYIQNVQYTKIGPAPGENPQGTRQPERAKKRNTDGDASKGGSYATKRNKAGAKGTILTGARGLLGSGTGGSKTLLGN